MKPPAAAVAFVPLTLQDIKVPDGMTVDAPLMTEFLGVMNNQELTPAQRAQSLTDLQVKFTTLASEKGREAWNTLQTQWQTDVKADPEIGGDKFAAVGTRIGAALEKFGDAETRKAFDLTGAGNNPAIIKFINKLTLALGEGTLVPGGKPGAGTGKSEAEIASRLYPTMTA